MNFVKTPNLPEKKVKSVIVDYRCDEKIINSLKKLGIYVYLSCNVKSLYPAVCGHPDMSIYHVGGSKFVCEPSTYEYYSSTLNLPGIELFKGNVYLNGTYPYDIAYNVARVSENAFHRLGFTDRTILEYSENINFINVAQGYSKCSVAVIAENAIITDDDSILVAAINNNIDVLKISKGGIRLNGFDYGFFGGAVGLIDCDTLVITGNVEKHVDYEKIFEFCAGYGVKLYNLSDEEPVDIGSIIPVAYE